MEKKWEFWDPKKGGKSVPKWYWKGYRKKSPEKVRVSYFFMNFSKYTVFYRSEWASRADSTVFYSVFTRPEGQENDGQCGQNLRKTMIFVFFFNCLRKCFESILGVPRHQNWGEKVVPKHWKSEGKNGLKTKSLGNPSSTPKRLQRGTWPDKNGKRRFKCVLVRSST